MKDWRQASGNWFAENNWQYPVAFLTLIAGTVTYGVWHEFPGPVIAGFFIGLSATMHFSAGAKMVRLKIRWARAFYQKAREDTEFQMLVTPEGEERLNLKMKLTFIDIKLRTLDSIK